MSESGVVFEAIAEATLFGFDATPSEVRIRPRSRGWRVGGAVGTFVGVVAVASPLVVFPPHAVWLIGGLGTGAFLANRRYIERFTLLSAIGACPKCGHGFSLKNTRLRAPHPLPCEGCHHESTLQLPDGLLQKHALD
ncbi:MAG: hypothetical protein L7S64_03490 [Longimicrobiales bacterium]|nr:hypothetical protein [Longimicrobiales bacterium]